METVWRRKQKGLGGGGEWCEVKVEIRKRGRLGNKRGGENRQGSEWNWRGGDRERGRGL